MNNIWLLLVLLLAPSQIWAQNPPAPPAFLEELEKDGVGLHVGRLLPNQIDGVTEIISLWGLRYEYGMGGGHTRRWVSCWKW